MSFSFSVANNFMNSYMFGKPNVVVFRPSFALVPTKNDKKLSKKTLVVVKAHSASGIEVEFKPSFDEYVKAMESVKTVREKRIKRDLNEQIDSKEVRESENRKNVRWEKDKGNMEDEKDCGYNGRSVSNPSRDETFKGNERNFVSRKNVKWEKDNTAGSFRNQISDGPFKENERNGVHRKNGGWEKDKGSVGEKDHVYSGRSVSNPNHNETFNGNERNSVYRKNGRWEKDTGSVGEKDRGYTGRSIRNPIQDETFKRNERSSVYRNNGRLEKDAGNIKRDDGYSGGSVRNTIRDEPFKGNERNSVYRKNGRWEKDKGNSVGEEEHGSSRRSIPNPIQDEPFKVNVKKIGRWEKDKGSIAEEDHGIGKSFRNPIQYKSLNVNQRNFGVNSTERLNMYDRNVRWDENWGDNTFAKKKDRNEGRFDMYDRNVRWEENQGKMDRTQENDRSFRVDKDEIGGAKMVLGSEKLSVGKVVVRRRNSGVDEESDGDEEFGFERAAFKPVGGFNDIVDKPRASRNEMEERMQKLARCLNGADVDMPEWMFSKMMRSAKIRYSDHSIMRIIQILGNLGNWKRVLQLIDWLQSRERFKPLKLRNIYTTALGVLGKARRPVEALNLFHNMQQHMSSYPDLVTYRSIAVTLGQAGHMRELFEVIDTMKSHPKKNFGKGLLEKWDPRLEPDIVVYNAVLNACVRRKQWEGAFWVLQQLQGKGQNPSGTTYGLVMEVMLACGKYNLVYDIYRKVLKSSIPNALTYKVLVNTLWREGKADEALLVVADMERRGVVGSAALYYDLARCLCSVGRCQEALVQVDKICRVANKPLVVTYTGLMQACLNAGNIEDGAYVFKHMHKFCSPNLVTCNIMLKGYIDHGKFEEAKKLFQKLLEDGNKVHSKADYKDRVIPDTYSFNTMLDACVGEHRWDDFEVVYKGMLEYGYPFNAKRHLRMILDAGRAGKGGLLETTWNHLIRNGQILPHSLVKELFCMKIKQGDCAVALSYISNYHHSNVQVFSRNAWLNLFEENAHHLQQDSLLKLVDEANLLISSDVQHLVLQNLVLASREFLKTRMNVSQADCIKMQTVLC